jgi:hypothetical protein
LSGLQCQAHLSKEESERHWSQPLLHNSERGRVDRFGVFLMLMTLYLQREREREQRRYSASLELSSLLFLKYFLFKNILK